MKKISKSPIKFGITFTLITISLSLLLTNIVFAPSITKEYFASNNSIYIYDAGNKIAELQLIDNIDNSLMFHETTIRIRSSLPLTIPPSSNSNYNLIFTKASNNMPGIDNFSFELLQNVTYVVTNEYEVCGPYKSSFTQNGTEIQSRTCTRKTDSYLESKSVYRPFSFLGHTFDADQDYYIKIKGRKKLPTASLSSDGTYDVNRNDVEWLLTFHSLQLKEWAWWSTTWSKCRNINLGNTAVNRTFEPIGIDISSLSGNFTDTRVVNDTCSGAGTVQYELPTQKVGSIIYFLANVTNISNVIYQGNYSIYYENTTPTGGQSCSATVGCDNNLKINTTTNSIKNSFIKWDADEFSVDAYGTLYWNNTPSTEPPNNPNGKNGVGGNNINGGFTDQFVVDIPCGNVLCKVTAMERTIETYGYWARYNKSVTLYGMSKNFYTNLVGNATSGQNDGSRIYWVALVEQSNATSFQYKDYNGNIQTPVLDSAWHTTTADPPRWIWLPSSGDSFTNPSKCWVTNSTDTTSDWIRDFYASGTTIYFGSNASYQNPGLGNKIEFMVGLGVSNIVNCEDLYTEFKNPLTYSFGEEVEAFGVNETQGRNAIVQGIQNVLGSNAPIYTDQLVYIRNSTNYQQLGRFDKVTKYGNQIWAFNYVSGNESYTNMPNLGKVFNVNEMANKSFGVIVSTVESFINQTKN